MELVQKQLATEIKAVDDEARTMTFVMSSESRDRDGDIIEVGGWKLDNFMKNPVFLLFHDQRQFPIGRVERIWSEDSKLLGQVRFAEKGTYETADIAYELYKQGIMNAVSVSFAGRAYEPMEEGGLRFTEQELYELSAVPVPANAEAVAVARKASNLGAILSEAEPEAIAPEKATELDEALTEATKAIARMIAILEGTNGS